MASVFWQDVRHLHEAMEVPTATPPNSRHQIRTEEMANRRDRLEDRTTLLPLLVSMKQ